VTSWWGGKIRQFRRYLTGRVTVAECAELIDWLTPQQLALFDSMHPADQRHGLDVMAALRADGHTDPDLLLAGLLHDAGKGRRVGLWHRVTWSLGWHYGDWVLTATRWLPGFTPALAALRDHAERSARLALEAGCSTVTAELIRHQAEPVDPIAGEALRLADEAN
jgi:hypothetical protein